MFIPQTVSVCLPNYFGRAASSDAIIDATARLNDGTLRGERVGTEDLTRDLLRAVPDAAVQVVPFSGAPLGDA